MNGTSSDSEILGVSDRNDIAPGQSLAGRAASLRDLLLLPLGGEAVAFSERSQRLLSLNSSAAMVVSELQRGAGLPGLAQRLESEGLAPREHAEAWVQATLEALEAHGMQGEVPPDRPPAAVQDEVGGLPPYTPFEPAAQQHYRLLETCALVRFGSFAQVRLINSVIGHLATEAPRAPDVVIDLKADLLSPGQMQSDIYRDGVPVGRAPHLSRMAPIVKAALWQSAVNAYDFLFYIHAAVVGTGGSCILLPARPGSGKSSLTVGLLHRGFHYFSDEVALICPGSFHVSPMPLALALKDTGWDIVARYRPDLGSLPVHLRSDGKVIRYLPPPPESTREAPAPVSHIFFPRYQADAATRLEPVSRPEALRRLMDECLSLRCRLDEGLVRRLVGWIGELDCYELSFSCLDEAVNIIVRTTGFSGSETRAALEAPRERHVPTAGGFTKV